MPEQSLKGGAEVAIGAGLFALIVLAVG